MDTRDRSLARIRGIVISGFANRSRGGGLGGGELLGSVGGWRFLTFVEGMDPYKKRALF